MPGQKRSSYTLATGERVKLGAKVLQYLTDTTLCGILPSIAQKAHGISPYRITQLNKNNDFLRVREDMLLSRKNADLARAIARRAELMESEDGHVAAKMVVDTLDREQGKAIQRIEARVEERSLVVIASVSASSAPEAARILDAGEAPAISARLGGVTVDPKGSITVDVKRRDDP